MYYCNARYYDPTTGRFISADDISYLDPETINGLNLFSYCGNNPVMNVDPSGHIAFAITLLISVGLSLAFELAEDLITDGQLGGDKDWLDYLGAGISGVIGALPGLNAFSKLGKWGKLVLDVSFSLASGIIDSAISGDMAENGFWNSVGNIVLSTTISLGSAHLAKRITSTIKANNILRVKDSISNKAANSILRKIGVDAYVGSKKYSKIWELSNILYKSNTWTTIRIIESIFSSLGGGISGLIF